MIHMRGGEGKQGDPRPACRSGGGGPAQWKRGKGASLKQVPSLSLSTAAGIIRSKRKHRAVAAAASAAPAEGSSGRCDKSMAVGHRPL